MTENARDSADSAAPATSAAVQSDTAGAVSREASVDASAATRRPPLQGLRRTAIVVLIVSVTITAAIGIFTLLNGEFGDVQGRILSTTLFVAFFSVLALCHLAVAGRPVRVVGFVGLAVSAVALVTGILVVWLPWENPIVTDLWRVLGVTAIIAASLAQANLLLLLASRRRTVIRVGLAVTLTAIAVVAIMSSLPLAIDGVPGEHWETYWRWMGVAAIVDALGTIALPVLALLVRDPVEGSAGSAAPDATGLAGSAATTDASGPTGPTSATDASGTTVEASARSALDDRVDALAAATGLDREALLHAALDDFEARRASDGPSAPVGPA